MSKPKEYTEELYGRGDHDPRGYVYLIHENIEVIDGVRYLDLPKVTNIAYADLEKVMEDNFLISHNHIDSVID